MDFLELVRTDFDEDSTIGELKVNGVFQCYTLEDTIREVTGKTVAKWKVAGKTAIPFGRYEVRLTFSNRFQLIMPQLMDVPGFEGIRIHVGNTDKDTEGCILLGETKGSDMISKSRIAFNKFYPLLSKELDSGRKVFINIADGRFLNV